MKEKVVAAAMLHFLDSCPNERAKLSDRLDRFIGGKKKSPFTSMINKLERVNKAISLLMGPYTRDKIENWVSDYDSNHVDGYQARSISRYTAGIVDPVSPRGCVRGSNIEPEDIEEPDVKPALLKLAEAAVAREH